MSMSVAIADNHDVTRWGVRSVVERMQGSVVATAETGFGAVSAVEEHAPDLLILSLKLPHLNGFDVLYHLQRRTLGVDALVLTTCTDVERAKAVFERGASAYLLKQDPLNELRRAITTVRGGGRYVSDSLPDTLLETVETDEPEHSDPCKPLTMREREVVQLTAEGFTSREVGEYLNISPRTVEKHRENIKKKLGVHTIVEMARLVLQRGVLPDSRILRSKAAMGA